MLENACINYKSEEAAKGEAGPDDGGTCRSYCLNCN